jgi:ribosomal protein S18 acetylase RimI-like enzyme
VSPRDFTIRTARLDDIESLTSLLLELFQIEQDFTPDPERQRAGLKQLLNETDAAVLVAENRERILGMCTVQKVISTAEGGPTGLLEDMVVNWRFRRMGIGRALLKAAEEWATQRGLVRLQLLSEVVNDAAQSFYFKSGWRSTGLVCRRKMLHV